MLRREALPDAPCPSTYRSMTSGQVPGPSTPLSLRMRMSRFPDCAQQQCVQAQHTGHAVCMSLWAASWK